MRLWLPVLMWFAASLAWAAPGYAVWGDVQVSAGFHALRLRQSRRAQGRRTAAGGRLAHLHLRQVQPVHAQGHRALVPGRPAVRGAADRLDGRDRRRPTACWPQDVEVAPDRLSATFRLRPEARFHNGDPVLAADVKHSYDTLVSKYAAPGLRDAARRRRGLRRAGRAHGALPASASATASCRWSSAACRCSAASGAAASRSTRW